MSAVSGVPIKLLHEGESHIVTVELKTGEIYRGILVEAEDTMNCQLKEVTYTARDGRISKLELVFLRGGNIKFIVLPDILKNASVLQKVQQVRAKVVNAATLAGNKSGPKGAAGPAAKKQRKE